MRRALLLVAVFAAGTASCQLVFGLDDFHPTGSTSSGASANGGHSGEGGSGSGADTGAGATGGASNRCGPGAACAAMMPPGFDGFFNFIESAPQDAPDHCASGEKPVRFYEGSPKGCSDCGCDDPPAKACSAPAMDTWLISSCPGGLGVSIGTFDGACVANPGSFKVVAATPVCTATATSGQIQETAFPTTATLCKIDVPTGECGPGLACAPIGSPICIVQSGNVNCPSPWNTRTVVYGDKMDTRHCSKCDCAPQFACQNGWNQFSSSDCTGMATTLAPGACSQAGSAIYQDLLPTGTVTCTPSQVQETGMFTPIDPSTICCATL